jgi:hypothetical protein
MTCHLRGTAALLDEKRGLPVLAAELSAATGKKVCVEGVSCLGRCDRAPVAWAERWPVPAGGHARVYAGRTRAQLEEVLRRLATGDPPPKPDSDADYAPNTNPGWAIDVYAREGWPRDYRAVRKFVERLTAARRRAVPRPPRGADLDQYVRENHPLLWS